MVVGDSDGHQRAARCPWRKYGEHFRNFTVSPSGIINIDADTDTNGHRYTNSNRDSDANRDTYTHADADSDTYAHGDTYANGDADTNFNTDAEYAI